MVISFERVNPQNLSDYTLLENDTLARYMSRTRPNNYSEKTVSLLFWMYICLDFERIGVVWLEKEKEESTIATLGIFITNDVNTRKGVGQTAIEDAIKQAGVQMRFTQIELRVRANNERAIGCYKKCGFIEINRFIKNLADERVETITMCRNV